MAKRVEALINPEILAWARRTAGFAIEDVAARLGVSVDRLRNWESGEERLSVTQLRDLASVYKRPLAVFYLPKPPRDFKPMHDFRRLPEAANGKYSPELLLEIRRAREKREIALELAAELGSEIPQPRVRLRASEKPNETAARVREILNVSVDAQPAWRSVHEALNAWKVAIERHGVLVFHGVDLDPDEARGFSISERPLPVIVVASGDSPNGRIFTILHEFVHVLIHSDGVCDLDERKKPQSEEARVEAFCNGVAGAILVPAKALLAAPGVAEAGRGKEWTDEELRVLARNFWVSREVILRRLLVLEKTTRQFYEAKRAEFRAAYRAALEEPRQGFMEPPQRAIRNLGNLFTRLVLNAFHQEAITSSDLSDYLGVKLRHVPKIEEMLLSAAR